MLLLACIVCVRVIKFYSSQGIRSWLVSPRSAAILIKFWRCCFILSHLNLCPTSSTVVNRSSKQSSDAMHRSPFVTNPTNQKLNFLSMSGRQKQPSAWEGFVQLLGIQLSVQQTLFSTGSNIHSTYMHACACVIIESFGC